MNLPSNQITQNNASQDLDPNSVGRMKIIFFPVEKKTLQIIPEIRSM